MVSIIYDHWYVCGVQEFGVNCHLGGQFWLFHSKGQAKAARFSLSRKPIGFQIETDLIRFFRFIDVIM